MNTIVKAELAETGDSPFGAAISGTNPNIAKFGKYKDLLGYDTMEHRDKAVGRLGKRERQVAPLPQARF